MAPPSKKSQSKKFSKPASMNVQNPSKKPFKAKGKGDVSTMPLQLEDDVPDFPRGSSSAQSPFLFCKRKQLCSVYYLYIKLHLMEKWVMKIVVGISIGILLLGPVNILAFMKICSVS